METPIVSEQPSGVEAKTSRFRYSLTNALLTAFVAALVCGGWYVWLALGVTMTVGTVADELFGDDLVGAGAAHWSYNANLYATLPMIVLGTFIYLQHMTLSDPFSFIALLRGWGIVFAGAPSLTDSGPRIGATIGLGLFFALAAVTVGHELIHRSSNRIAVTTGRLLLAFTFNTSFSISHQYSHHRHVGTEKDSATAKRGENVFQYALRATVGGLKEAYDHEARRLQRKGLRTMSWRNRALRGQAFSILILACSGAIAGLPGFVGLISAAAIGRFFHEAINYVQHYGLVRDERTPVEARHSWDCHRNMSNALLYNMPRHAAHHTAAMKPFWQLAPVATAPTLPHGYQAMALIALVPPLWRAIMDPLVADWDRRFATDAERSLTIGQGAMQGVVRGETERDVRWSNAKARLL